MIFKEFIVLSLALISRIDGRSIDSPYSYTIQHALPQSHVFHQAPVSHMEFRSHYSPISYDLTHPPSSITKPPKMIINVQPITPNVVKPTKPTRKSPIKSNERNSSKLTKRNSSKSVQRKSFKTTDFEQRSSKLTKRAPLPIPIQNGLDGSSENLIKIVRRMRKNYTDTEMRILSTIGLISGALNVEEAMRTNLNRLADEYYDKYNLMSPEHNAKKMLQIEEAINRDKLASNLLASALKLAREAMNIDDFQKDMKRLMNEVG